MVEQVTWHDVIEHEKQQDYFQQTLSYVENEREQGKIIYPPEQDVFNAFRFTELANVRVVIIGQDPYHGPKQAHGLCFSVLPEVKVPPSLVNIYKELASDIDGFQIPDHGYLKSWAESRGPATEYRVNGRAGYGALSCKNRLGNVYRSCH